MSLLIKKKAIPPASVGYGIFAVRDTDCAPVYIKEDGQVVDLSSITTPPVFGAEYQHIKDSTVSTTTSLVYTNKLTLTTTNLPSGDYRVGWCYNYNHNSTQTDFMGRVMLNSITELNSIVIEPQDSAGTFGTTGTDQKYINSGFDVISLSGVNTLTIDFATSNTNDASSIWNAILEIHRVS